MKIQFKIYLYSAFYDTNRCKAALQEIKFLQYIYIYITYGKIWLKLKLIYLSFQLLKIITTLNVNNNNKIKTRSNKIKAVLFYMLGHVDLKNYKNMSI